MIETGQAPLVPCRLAAPDLDPANESKGAR